MYSKVRYKMGNKHTEVNNRENLSFINNNEKVCMKHCTFLSTFRFNHPEIIRELCLSFCKDFPLTILNECELLEVLQIHNLDSNEQKEINLPSLHSLSILRKIPNVSWILPSLTILQTSDSFFPIQEYKTLQHIEIGFSTLKELETILTNTPKSLKYLYLVKGEELTDQEKTMIKNNTSRSFKLEIYDGKDEFTWKIPRQIKLLRALQSNIYQDKYLCAGRYQFHYIWIRDICLASRALANYPEGRKLLINTLKLYKKYGELNAVSFDSTDSTLRVVCSMGCCHSSQYQQILETDNLLPGYGNTQDGPSDSAIMILYALFNLKLPTGNKTITDEFYENLIKHYKKNKDGLIIQGGFADFYDSHYRQGSTFYINYIYYIVAKHFQLLDTDELNKLNDAISKTFIRETLIKSHAEGDEDYQISLDYCFYALYKDVHPLNNKLNTDNLIHKLRYFSVDGKGASINYTKATFPFLALACYKNYHKTMCWPWLECFCLEMLIDLGEDNIQHRIKSLELQFDTLGTLYEVCDSDLQPYQTLMTKSDENFSMSLLYMYLLSFKI